jgi:dTDP-4-dehydrorhamnose reductase
MWSISMRVLITGGRGQLAVDLADQLAGNQVLAPSHKDLDIMDREACDAAMRTFCPDVVINTAAYHLVDQCETEPEAAFAVNAAAVRRLAVTCRDIGALFVHVSTDYVFSGATRTPYPEDAPVEPISVYGASKAAGEMAVRCTAGRYLIVRTTGLYGHARPSNFVETMLRMAREGREIRVVDDQVLTPSATADVATALVGLVQASVTGIVHVTNTGACSWYEFAAAIFRISGVSSRLAPTTQAERPSPARRPAYSVLAHDGLRHAGLPDLPPWTEALERYLRVRS